MLSEAQVAALIQRRYPARWSDPPRGHVAQLLRAPLRALLPEHLADLLAAPEATLWCMLNTLLTRLDRRGMPAPAGPAAAAARVIQQLMAAPQAQDVRAVHDGPLLRELAYAAFGGGPWPTVAPGTVEMVALPPHRPTFELARLPVTQQQWRAVMGAWPAWRDWHPQRPMTEVSWREATAFCARLDNPGRNNEPPATASDADTIVAPPRRTSGATSLLRLGLSASGSPHSVHYFRRGHQGRGLRLPTADEWRRACLAGATTRFAHGDAVGPLGAHGWFGGHPRRDAPRAVGRLVPNAWGLFDLHGNVWEWCADVFAGDGARRVCLGGSFCTPAEACAATFTSRDHVDRRRMDLGFRLARSL